MASPNPGLYEGSSAALRGLRFAAGQPEVRAVYRRLMAILTLASLALTAALIATLWHFTAIGDGDTTWAAIGLWLVRLAGGAVILFAAPIIALMIVNALVPVLAERTFLAALGVLRPARARALAEAEGLSFSAGVGLTLRRLVHFLGVTILCFAVTFIPLVGAILGPLLQLAATARALTWELLDPYFDRRRMSYAEQRALLRARRGAIIGFGAPLSFVLGIPLVGPLFFGLAQAGVAMLVAEVLEPEST
ncbi:MAG: EI24 domain-containing protein [Nannocystaceae bacterium]